MNSSSLAGSRFLSDEVRSVCVCVAYPLTGKSCYIAINHLCVSRQPTKLTSMIDDQVWPMFCGHSMDVLPLGLSLSLSCMYFGTRTPFLE